MSRNTVENLLYGLTNILDENCELKGENDYLQKRIELYDEDRKLFWKLAQAIGIKEDEEYCNTDVVDEVIKRLNNGS